MSQTGKTLAGLCITAILLTACAEKPSVTATDHPADTVPAMNVIATGVALPAGYKVDAGRTMVFGTDENWTGRVAYSTKSPADEVFDFLHKEMPNFGWTEMTSMRSDVSLLTFSSDNTNRIALVRIGRGGVLGSTDVDMVVTPREAAQKSASVHAAPLPTK